jgi:very-short-patch-repair endonuclease
MSLTKNQEKFIVDEYVEKNKSTYEISESLGTYPNKVRRTLVKLGVKLRDKSKAQSTAIKSGRHKHPTQGTERSESDKLKISEGMSSHWEHMDDEERQRRSETAKQQWDNMTDEERENLRRAAAEAVRRAAKEGSKVEKFLREGLTRAGRDVIFHKTGLVANANLEIDLFIPSLKVAIEVDGPAHFLPIWGEENLKKRIKSDSQKSGLLLQAGYVVLRIKHLTKNLSGKRNRDLLGNILEILDDIEKKFPQKSQRFIEIEL